MPVPVVVPDSDGWRFRKALTRPSVVESTEFFPRDGQTGYYAEGADDVGALLQVGELSRDGYDVVGVREVAGVDRSERSLPRTVMIERTEQDVDKERPDVRAVDVTLTDAATCLEVGWAVFVSGDVMERVGVVLG